MITHAYSVREPWGWLTIDGFKLCEIRSRAFTQRLIGQWVALHCSSNTEIGDDELIEDLVMLDEEVEGILENEKWDDDSNRLFGFSEIIGAVKIVASLHVVDKETSEGEIEQLSELLSKERRSPRQESNIDPAEWLAPDSHHWVIGDVHRFKTPIQCLGRLGVWALPPILRELVAKQAKQPTLERGGSYTSPVIFEKPKRKYIV